MRDKELDAVVVGSGPNGLAAAITLARAGLSVRVLEANKEPGGALSSAELTLPGFVHDVGSAVHPMAVISPFFRSLPLEHHGLEWIRSASVLAHPIGDTCVLLDESVEKTAAQFGLDEHRYRRIFGPLTREWENLVEEVLQPALHLPKHPILLARFGAMAMLSATSFTRGFFRDPKAQALFAGIAAHTNAPLDRSGTAAIGMMLTIAGHARGWPIPKGGAGRVTRALVSYFVSQGGRVETGRRIETLADLPKSRLVFFDLTTQKLRELFEKSGEVNLAKSLPSFRHGPGVFKVDWALSAPIPWSSADVAQAATVHIGGPVEQIERSEARPAKSENPKRPFVLLSQPTLFDPSRAPEGKHIAWAYCHVPNASSVDCVKAIEDEIERYAPGFKSVILKKHVSTPASLEAWNSNLVGGDISGGEFKFWSSLVSKRSTAYEISLERGYFACSSSTPPGPGVHGMCGFNAANSALGLEQLLKS